MAKKRRIALIYQYNENWIGGTYYIENLVAALKLLEDSQQPLLYVFTDPKDFEKLKYLSGYKYLFYKSYSVRLNLFQRAVNKVASALFKLTVFSTNHKNIDLVFPAHYYYSFIPGAQYLYWIPDFQEHYLPGFFSEDEIVLRKANQQDIVSHGRYIVFSSQTAKRHFNEIYPGALIKQFVLPFAVSHLPVKAEEDIKAKYKLPDNFFICSNQFWIHKNHKVVIEAVISLKRKGIDVFIAFTGKENDYRHPEYCNDLKQLISDKGVGDNCIFLGFIDRGDQLALMSLSKAVIQPSLFEGWSTVIEDAKSLGANIIASGIDVHKEQLEHYENKIFFDAAKSEELVNCLKWNFKANNKKQYDYHNDIAKFGTTFIQIVNRVLTNK